VLPALTIPVDVTGSFDTGVAFFNPGSAVLTLAFKLLDANGVLVSSITRSLPSKNHLATFVDQLFSGIAGFRGSLAISATGGVAATTLRQFASGATYTTLPAAAGTAAGRTQIMPLLTTTVTGLNAIAGDPDVALSEKLVQGSLISGTVTGAGRGIMVVASSGGNNLYSSQVNPLTGRYLIVVPDGTYNLTAYYQPDAAPNIVTLTMSYPDPNPVQVVFDAVSDITLPAATLFNVSGTVSGLAGLPSGSGAMLVFTSKDNTVQGQFALDAEGSYQGVLPAGSYTASINQNQALLLFNIGSLTVAGPAVGNYSVPAMATLSGSITGGGLTSLSSGTVVSAIDISAPATSQFSCCPNPGESTTSVGSTGQYQMTLARNRSFTVGVSIPVSLTPDESDTITYPVSPNPLNMGGDSTLDFSVPTIVRRVQIYGNVNDGSGHVIQNAVVTASSQSITGTANAGFSTSTRTDIYGNYKLLVPAGSNYRVTFVPPVPKP
jgi:hypothetical protein